MRVESRLSGGVCLGEASEEINGEWKIKETHLYIEIILNYQFSILNSMCQPSPFPIPLPKT